MSDRVIPPASALADVMLIRGSEGVLSPPLRHASGRALAVVGTARTVQFTPTEPGGGGTFDELYALLDEDLAGQIVVAAGAEAVVGAVWGQILSRAAQRAGAVAVLVAGAIRDVAEQRDAPLPVWALSEHTMGATGQARVSAVDVVVTIAGTTIDVGDTIVVDAGGAVRLARDDVDDLLEQGRVYANAESRLLDELAAGTPLVQAYEHKRVARKRIERW